jgi:hypothetical protein
MEAQFAITLSLYRPSLSQRHFLAVSIVMPFVRFFFSLPIARPSPHILPVIRGQLYIENRRRLIVLIN